MKSSKVRPVVVFTLAALTGCQNPFGGAEMCTTDRSQAVVVEIRNARTGAPLAGGAKGAVHDGAYVDSLRSHGSDGGILVSLAAAEERAGTYSVEVDHPGYRLWAAADVRVTADECGVRTRTIVASLEPSS